MANTSIKNAFERAKVHTMLEINKKPGLKTESGEIFNCYEDDEEWGVHTNTAGLYAHAEGGSTEAKILFSHAEGLSTKANGFASHTEGHSTQTLGDSSHAEGSLTNAIGDYSHAEGNGIGFFQKISITGDANTTTYTFSYATEAIFYIPQASDYLIYEDNNSSKVINSVDTKNNTLTLSSTLSSNSLSDCIAYIIPSSNSGGIAGGYYSHSEGFQTKALGYGSHSEGDATTALNRGSHAEGAYTNATGSRSHAEGETTTASGFSSHAEGWGTKAYGDYGSHAEGSQTYASGNSSHAEGHYTTAQGDYSHAEGYWTFAGSSCSHAEGNNTFAYGSCSHAEGYYTSALPYQHVLGHYNAERTDGNNLGSGSGAAFIIGNGTDSTANNAFRIDFNGNVYGQSTYNSSGADYAEYFEWLDGNTGSEDRRGYFVTMDEDKIKIAAPDDYILGIVSALPAVIGNGDEDWQGKFLHDEFGNYIPEFITCEKEKTIQQLNDEGELVDRKITVTEKVLTYKVNPNYDSEKEYTPRADRPEWDPVGMMGVLAVRDDGSCQVNGYCRPNDNGIATAAEKGYRVISRVNDHIIKVVFK